jgi:hypothetical protein
MTYFVGYDHIRFQRNYETIEEAESVARESSLHDGPFSVVDEEGNTLSFWEDGIGYFPKSEINNDPT